ncbi:hypothetical protein [Vreelandella neptunia]|uniref:site-specific DNA-methyltransferase (cytosine-N(4)-specific) n=1 Tax=Vreelandella neptunia TaxID=115551 RepID=A0ABZ0YQ50_9GAMM|nr:hypothetical protein [Halomonas neptunia]MDN3558609.1 hypothetical protein [Halomonas neptunia]WQH13579.1 hypothetical protein SR894_03325 [Halomonas neptunia]
MREKIQEIFNMLIKEYRSSNKSSVEVDFRKLMTWMKSGDQFTHYIHPYPAKLLPCIANFFSGLDNRPEEKSLLDPFCGSGTTCLEGSLAGYNVLHADANPLARLITEVKTTPYSVDKLKLKLELIVSEARGKISASEIHIVNHKLWYSDKNKNKLENLIETINEVCDDYTINFFKVCFSTVAKKFSYADPAISVPVKLKAKEKFSKKRNEMILERLSWIDTACVIDEFFKLTSSNIERVDNTNQLYPERKSSQSVGFDAKKLVSKFDRKTQMPDCSVSCIITSPPYGSAQKYIRASSLSLNWLQLASPKELSALEALSIGREHVPASRVIDYDLKLDVDYQKFIDKVDSINPRRAKINFYYLIELMLSLREMARVIHPGGRIVIVIGNNKVCGLDLRNDIFAKRILIESGLDLELALVDTIKSRGLMTKRNKTASMISRENVLVFRKSING